MSTQATTKWVLDNTHSGVNFQAKHLMISTVYGRFDKYNATVETDGDDFTKSKIDFSAEVASINTGNEQRDGHIRSAEFFDAEKYPQLTFTGKKLELVDGKKYLLTGDLSFHGVTKEVKLDVVFGGIAKDPWGNTKAGFVINGKINRKEWNLNWNVPLETGGLLVSEEVQINVEAQFAKA